MKSNKTEPSVVEIKWQNSNLSRIKNIGLFIIFIIFCIPFNLIFLAELIDRGTNKSTQVNKSAQIGPTTENTTEKELAKLEKEMDIETEFMQDYY